MAEAYAQAGATTVMVYVRNDAAVAKSKEYSEKYRVKVIAEKLDGTSHHIPPSFFARMCADKAVRDHSATDAFIQKLIKDLGRIDIWVANAGIAQEAIKIIGEDPKTWEDIIATNYTSIIYQAALLGAYWQDAKKGNFIITASGAGTSNIRPTNQVVYNSSKAAARNLARSLAQEFKDFARVNAVSRELNCQICVRVGLILSWCMWKSLSARGKADG